MKSLRFYTRRIFWSLLFITCGLSNRTHAQSATNPVIFADVPDMSIVRVGTDYYMSSTTMHMSPGVPIMKSTDLTNWKLISYAYDTLADIDAANLSNGKSMYGQGSWASCIRYHNGTFYVSTFASTTGKTYIFSTKNIEKGPWKRVSFSPSLHDHSIFFDDDGKTYLISGAGKLKIMELNDDLTGIRPNTERVLIENASTPSGTGGGLPAEGSQLFKVNGKYYLFNISWPKGGMRTVLIHRADKITGPWDGRVALQDRGIAQGGLIDMPDGRWFAYLFRDYGAVGRIPYLVPVTWQDGWPIIGSNGKAPETLALPKNNSLIPGTVVNDDFTRKSGDVALPLVWQWNHNPDNKLWSVAERKGYLRLKTGRLDTGFVQARNTLTQRTVGPVCTGTIALDLANMKDGDVAGLGLLQKNYGFIGVKLIGDSKKLVMVNASSGKELEAASVPLSVQKIFLRAYCNFTERTDTAAFYYSLDGTQWIRLGTPLKMSYTLPHFMGYRFALFNYATKNVGGYADFDFFNITDSKPADITDLNDQRAHDLWLQKTSAKPITVKSTGKTERIKLAIDELKQGWQGAPGATIQLSLIKNDRIKDDGFRLTRDRIEARTDLGLLYGTYEMLRRQRSGQSIVDTISNPSYRIRILNHWDNLDGSIERGYAGGSIFWHKDSSLAVTHQDSILWKEYARANASIGINAAVLNNVNASPLILSAPYLKRIQSIAAILRRYGITTYLAVKFSSPALLGGLKTSDPLDPEVIAWWNDKAKEIYSLIPDFGGLLVKASSEGQPGPQDFGRTHADGANMLADAVGKYGGLVMWRAFVYVPNDNDRTKQAYTEFINLDGKFKDNVIIQVKNGPLDFQPREPFSPLFGAMKNTIVMPELQITQEYMGHSVYLSFLSPMWEEVLQSDTYQEGEGSTVARVTDGSIFKQKYSAIAGVSNIGLDTNWCGHDFAQANWYAFGRLAWNNQLTSEQIAGEWIQQTFNKQPVTDNNANAFADDWKTNFLAPVQKMMLTSREVGVNFMTPLGLHHIMAGNIHYGPGPWWAPAGLRKDWTPPYYHQADSKGIGFDRTASGSNAVSQYKEPLASRYSNVDSCPENLLLWFHHLPWTYRTKSGRGLWDELCYRYDSGVKDVQGFQKTWDKVQAYVDSKRFFAVQHKLRSQAANAIFWKDACLLYFQTFSGMPIPSDIMPPLHNLDEMIANDLKRR